jgi:hypothetical protein
LPLQSKAVGEIVDSFQPHLSNSAESAEKSLRATLLAQPFPGTVAQEVVLVFLKDVRRL